MSICWSWGWSVYLSGYNVFRLNFFQTSPPSHVVRGKKKEIDKIYNKKKKKKK